MLGNAEALSSNSDANDKVNQTKDKAQTGYYITSFRKSNSRFGLNLCIVDYRISVCKYHGYASRSLRSHDKSLRDVGRLGRS